MFQKKTLREFTLAAGLWLTASACLAAPQPEPSMPLGASALPPRAFVAFCQRQPQDCGPVASDVLAAARRADAERAQLFAMMTPGQVAIDATAPAAVGDGASAGITKIAFTPASPAFTSLTPLADPITSGIAAVQIETNAAFVDPAQDARRAASSGPLAMTPDLWAKLNRVNDKVNRQIARRSDRDGYGTEDFWATPLANGAAYGDCEDYVLEKRRALLAAGLPPKALNIALVTTSWGEAHAVLLVATREGEFVLDNLSASVRPWRKTDYRWGQRQVDGDAFTWAMVAPARSAKPADGHLLIAALR